MSSPLAIPRNHLKRVVVAGGGFGGITLARKLRNRNLQVVLVDKNNYHTFQPLLYQVATGGLEPDSIAYPLRKIFRKQDNFFFRMAEILSVKSDENKVVTTAGDLEYDFLVLATGGGTNFFNNQNIERHAMGLKSLPDAIDLRSLLLQNFEKAQNGGSSQQKLLNVVVVGGGPTGVEMAGALAEFTKHVVPNDYPEIQRSQAGVWLVESDSRLLNGFSDKMSGASLKFLEKLGVRTRLNVFVSDYDGQTATLSDGSSISSACLVWSAGVKGVFPEGLRRASIGPGKRLLVDQFNRLSGYDNIFAIGDAAYMTADTRYAHGHPMVAQPAIQQARNLAHNLLRIQNKMALRPFRYRDLGRLATIGRNKAVAEFGKFRISGVLAWMLWMAVHLMALVGFRNRIVVLINWVWSYASYDRAIRLIVRPFSSKKLMKNSG